MHTGLAVMITGKCNGRCTYCYADGVARKKMRPEVFDQVLEHLARHHKTKWVSIIGGEPMYDPDHLIECVRKLSHVAENVAITTSLPDVPRWKKTLRELKASKVRITASVDGPPEIHDRQRPTLPHASVMEKLDYLRDIHWPARTIRATLDIELSRDNSPPWGHFIEGTMKVAARARCRVFSAVPSVMGVEPWDKMYDGVAEAVKLARTTRLPIWHQLSLVEMRKAQPYMSPKPSCGAGYCMLAVDPSGNLWPCHRMSWGTVGTIEQGIETERMREWQNAVCETRAKCVQCEAWDVCRGACSAEDEKGEINRASCEWWKTLIRASE